MKLAVEPKRVGIRFLIGEVCIATWRPKLIVIDPPSFGVLGKLDSPEIFALMCPDAIDGLLYRQVDGKLLAPGIELYGRWLRYIQQPIIHHCIEIKGSWEDYLRQWSGKSRQNLRRTVRRFTDSHGGEDCVKLFLTEGEMEAFYREAYDISKQTYQHKLLKSGMPGDASFVEHLVSLAKQGMARGYILRSGDVPVAFAWCRKIGDVLRYEIVGYRPEFSELSPGTVLLYYIVRDAYRSAEYRFVDFGPGDAHYKSMFGNKSFQYVDAYLFRFRLKNFACLIVHYSLAAFSQGVGRLLNVLGVKARVKHCVRALTGS
jgi:hypothetical protein